jgi:hypothetical protein
VKCFLLILNVRVSPSIIGVDGCSKTVARFLNGRGEKGACSFPMNVGTLFSKLVLTWMPSLVIWEALLYIFAGPSVKK